MAIAAVLLTAAPAALAVNPREAVGGPSSKWFSGENTSMWGQNCTIIGNPYSEVMVQGLAEYGGTDGVPKVGDGYYVAILISVPGNPCGSGSSVVATDLQLPAGTEPDPTRQIRCFGKPRNASTFGELTNGTWSFMSSSGRWCPSQATPTGNYTHAFSTGYRPVANGQFFEMFVPVKSSQPLNGAASSPAKNFTWYMHATGTYAQTAPTSVFANVFPAGTASGPYLYFARDPAAVPHYDPSLPDCAPGIGCHGRVELWVNLYTAGEAGELCWELYDPPSATTPSQTCAADSGSGFPLQIPAYPDSLAFSGNGPNGGYMPPLQLSDGDPFRIRWTYSYNGGANVEDINVTWTALPGPDGDGDGVPDSGDACPAKKGEADDGCPPTVQSDPDKDGVYGSKDQCPNVAGKGSLTGCPKVTLKGAITRKKPLEVKLAKLLGGVRIAVSCTLESNVAMKLRISKSTAGKLGVKVPAGKQSVVVASGKGACQKPGGGKPKLKAKSAHAGRLEDANRTFKGTLVTTFTRGGQKPVVLKPQLKVEK